MQPAARLVLMGGRAGVAFVLAAALVACAPPADECGAPVSYPPELRETTRPFLLRCDAVPELCGLEVTSMIRQPDFAHAIDLVFVGDGYPASELPALAAHVDALVESMGRDPASPLAVAPDVFNVHFVWLAAPGALQSCVEQSTLDGTWMLSDDGERVARVAHNAPDVDVVIVLRRGTHGRANSPGSFGDSGFLPPAVRFHADDDYLVLTHELGHALFALGDEYVDVDLRDPDADRFLLRTLDPLPANLSFSADDSFGGLVDRAVEGGSRYGHGIYHPTDDCRMLQSRSNAPFCPVCAAQIQRFLSAWRGEPDGPPECGMALDSQTPPPEGPLLRLIARDGNTLSSLQVSIDGGPPLSLPALASNRVVVTDLQVPAGSTVQLHCVDALGEEAFSTLQTP